MKYTGITYRPPYEADSLLVQVTQGCSRNRCSFCTMYRKVPFAVEDMTQIEHDLLEARSMYRQVKRIFLLNGDAFALSYARLEAIGKRILEIFPEVETIASYASIASIAQKSDVELQKLRQMRFNGMNIGLESGHKETLMLLGKDYTPEEAERQLMRLKSFGYEFCLNIIVGGGGPQYSQEHAEQSAQLLNRVQPWMIFLATLFLSVGSPLYEAAKKGEFIENTAGDNLREEEQLIRRLDLQNTFLLGMHTSNAVPLLGNFPEDKEKLLASLRKGIQVLDEEFLNSRPKRGFEGRYVS